MSESRPRELITPEKTDPNYSSVDEEKRSNIKSPNQKILRRSPRRPIISDGDETVVETEFETIGPQWNRNRNLTPENRKRRIDKDDTDMENKLQTNYKQKKNKIIIE